MSIINLKQFQPSV